ncbi:hypothetical protein RYX36_012094 [Vicia faba]
MALKFLKKDISRNSDDDDDDDVLEIYKCLKFSYDKLDEKAKSLFLLCSVFREDEDIHTESLTRLAIGGGLFGKDYGSYEEARSRVVKSKNKLLDSCLLLTSDMYIIFRELAESEDDESSKDELLSPQAPRGKNNIKWINKINLKKLILLSHLHRKNIIVTSEHNSSSQAPMDELTIDQQSPLEETDDATVTPSQELINEQSMTQHQSLPESHATIKPSKGNNDIKISVEGGKATTNAKTLASSTSKGETLSLLVKKELEQLVSEKHLNYETLSLLTDFLVKHPSVILKDTLLTNRYKGYAYNCLAELLKFLQTHSVLDVLGSSHSEFVGLIQDMRKFSFNKDWLDGVEKRALFPDLQFSRDAMQKLLDSKKHVTKQVEEMRLKLYFFNQHAEDIKHQLTSSEAVLASIIQQEEHVLETTAALSVPLGY